jgi:hypothetical protein
MRSFSISNVTLRAENLEIKVEERYSTHGASCLLNQQVPRHKCPIQFPTACKLPQDQSGLDSLTETHFVSNKIAAWGCCRDAVCQHYLVRSRSILLRLMPMHFP